MTLPFLSKTREHSRRISWLYKREKRREQHLSLSFELRTRRQHTRSNIQDPTSYMMALSVKAYLLVLPDQQEIRRFSIDDGASSNYEYLLTKIKTVFPGIRNKPLRLFWKGNLYNNNSKQNISFNATNFLFY